MLKLLANRWLQYFIGGLGFLAVGFAIGSSRLEEIPPERPDRVVFNAGSAELAQPVPLTAAGAVAEGWQDPYRCVKTQQLRALRTPGRFFSSELQSESVPYLLVYTFEGEREVEGVREGVLLGMYFFTETEMPPPWVHKEVRLFSVDTMDFEHWGLNVHFRDWKTACGKFVARAKVLN